MNSLVPASFGAVSTKFAGKNANDDLSSGIQSSFGLIGYKGKVWSIRYRGDETKLMRDDGDGPRGSIEVVILKASPNVSKIWYEQGYVEGSNAAPDCFSNNGIRPEPTSTKKQCESCALCPHNQWGSRITPAGKQGKACSDSKRLAVVPLGDIENEAYGGPMLLRVPAASLQDIAMYGQKMNQLGYPYFSVGTRISFDAQESYPKFTFGAIRPLTDEEADLVLATQEGHTVDRILSEDEFVAAPAAAAADVSSAFEQPPEEQAKPDTVGDKARAAAAKAAEGKEAKPRATTKKAPPPVEATDAVVEKVEEKPKSTSGFGGGSEQKVTTKVTPEESDEDRELREMEEMLAKKKAEAAAKRTAAAQEASAKETVSAKEIDVAVEDVPHNSSSIENELDDLLSGLLPDIG